jgi:hypothetical protein
MTVLKIIKSFTGVQGAVFQKSPLAAGGKKIEFSDRLLRREPVYKKPSGSWKSPNGT